MNLTEREIKDICKGCGPSIRSYGCVVRGHARVWHHVCLCSQCLVKIVCKELCPEMEEWIVHNTKLSEVLNK